MIGRADKLDYLNQNFTSEKNNLTILYGRHGSGKTTLIKEFVKDKNYFYFESVPGHSFDITKLELLHNQGINLFVFEEFQLLVKAEPDFMNAIVSLLSEHSKIMVVLCSSSVLWVENSMVKSIGKAALSINSFMKLKELNYSDFVYCFPQFEADNLLKIYGITGGNPEYISRWDGSKNIKDNICTLFLKRDGVFYNEAFNYIRDEFREIGVYNTILYCLASGRNKLNEIHEYTGFGRDKISVYLKNLIAREIVEKIFSYDVQGNENTRKGLYRIKDGFLDFWFRYIFPNRTTLGISDVSDFYDRYIDGRMDDFFKNAFIKIAGEMLEIMNDMGRLPFHVEKKGGWYGKNGDIHLIFEDEDANAIVGQVFTKKENVSIDDFNLLVTNVELAGINVKHYFLFAIGAFDSDIIADNVTTIGINDL